MNQMNKLLKDMQKVQAKLQENLARAQEELRDKTVEGSAGGGLVKVVMNGHKELIKVSIDKSAVDANEVETLEDLVFAAVKSALDAAAELYEQTMAGAAGEMGGLLPPGMF
jgi:hypothetical protein